MDIKTDENYSFRPKTTMIIVAGCSVSEVGEKEVIMVSDKVTEFKV